jgi:hypothetical protein
MTQTPETYDFARVVHNYLQQFHCSIKLDKGRIRDKMELYLWCNCLGIKYKDWFIHEGGARDKFWVIHIRSPKMSTFFRLKWNDLIIESIDKQADI